LEFTVWKQIANNRVMEKNNNFNVYALKINTNKYPKLSLKITLMPLPDKVPRALFSE
jgi:hypothetical protein